MPIKSGVIESLLICMQRGAACFPLVACDDRQAAPLSRPHCACNMLWQCFCRYFITSGSKFGADFLLYLGDPVEQHAVACVRIIDPHRQPSPVLLAGAVRSAFGARKDLLLATVDDDLQTVHYLTLTPEPSPI